MATKHPQRRRKTDANRAKRLANLGGRKIIPKRQKQFIYAMNNKPNGKSRLKPMKKCIWFLMTFTILAITDSLRAQGTAFFGLLRHFWLHKQESESKILTYQCTTGRLKGRRLDGWILKDEKTLFQVEVKNNCAYAIEGETLKYNVSV